MANLVITTESLGLKLVDENTGEHKVINNWSISRYAGSDIMHLVDNKTEEHALFEIIFSDYTAVTFNAAAIATMDILQTTLEGI